MEIKTKYNIGDKFYTDTFANRDYKTVKCPVCEGKEKLIINDFAFKCPKCYGYGEISVSKAKYRAAQFEIKEIRITVNKNNVLIQYDADEVNGRESYLFEEKHIIRQSKKKAQEKADQKTQEEEWEE